MVAPDPSWLCHKVYVGQVAGGMEHLVTTLLPVVRDLRETERWFFIRYVDRGGLHLRLRVRAARSRERLRALLDPAIGRALHELPSVPPPLYRPAVVLAAPRPRDDREVIRAVEGDYEPEVPKFGARGVEIAEKLFQQSSELAVDVLTDELSGAYARKTLVPCFMQCVADVFAPDAGAAFWDEYAAYWLDLLPVPGAAWRRRFAAKAEQLRAGGIRVVAPASQLPGDAAARLGQWRGHLRAAARAYAVVGDDPPVATTTLAFHFTHLMNNRLGVQPLEEAYYSTLIDEQATTPSR